MPHPIRSRRAGALALVLAVTLAVAPRAGAQATASAPAAPVASLVGDLAVNSAFVWRGVTFTNRPVVQADASLLVAAPAATLSAGLWANAEPADYRRPADLRLIAAGHAGPAVTALTSWLDLTRSAGRVAATAGVTSYWYPAITGYASAFNTSELYGRVAVTAPLSPRLAIYVDVEKVRGAYLEATVGAPVAAGSHAVALAATAGASLGQATRDGQSAYFAHDGLAFADLSATTSFAVRGVALAPAAHLVLDRDAFTRVVDAAGGARAAKVWIGLTATCARPLATGGPAH